MSIRIRGQEATIRLQVEGRPQTGSFLKTLDFELTPRQDLQETDFNGEAETDIDLMHHGYDFKFTAHVVDDSTIAYLRDVADRHATGQAPPRVTLVVILAYREPGARPRSIVLPASVMKVGALGSPDRKQFITHAFEGKCKRANYQNV